MNTKLDKISFIILQVVLFFTPIFFIPMKHVPFQLGKASFIIYGIILALILWIIARLKDGSFEVPKSFFYASAGVLGLAYVVATFFSGSPAVSIASQSFELGTLSFFLPALVLFALIPLVVKTKEQIFYSYVTLLGSFFVMALFHGLRFILGPGFLSFGILTEATSNLIGKWNDVAVFFGLGTLLSLITLERIHLTKLSRILTYVCLVVSLLMLAIFSFPTVWLTLAAFSIVFLIYGLSFGKQSHEHGALMRIPYHTIGVLVISLLFAFVGGNISSSLVNKLGTSQVEVRPSWSATIEVAKTAIATNPLFGAGPNRFSSEWLLNKPGGINNTQFFNVDFNYGIGFIPTLLVTTGIVGFAAVVLFIVLFAMSAVRALFKAGSSPLSRYLVLSSLFGSAYLWVFSIIYVPSSAIWVLTLALSGLFVAALREDGLVTFKNYSVIGRPAASFVSVLVSILVLIGAISFGYFVTTKFMAVTTFQKGILSAQSGANLDTAEQYISDAMAISPSDLYYQSISEVYLARLNNLLNDKTITAAEGQKRFQAYLSTAIQGAQAAVAFDPKNYQNFVELGRVFEAVLPLNIAGSFESAKKAYETALSLNPDSPELYLILARLSVENKDAKNAEIYVNKSIEKKADYADAIFLLSQIQVANGDLNSAIKSVSAVATLSPSNAGIFFQLGLLYYNQKDYQNAGLAFERAVNLNPEYANAKYFLGLTYYLTGSTPLALGQFKDLEKTNPDNADVKSVIANLEAGKAPFVQPSAPVKKTSLPVKEKTPKTAN